MNYTFDKLVLDPVKNPAVLNTFTWDVEAVKNLCASKLVHEEANSLSSFQGKNYCIGSLNDGQKIIIADTLADTIFTNRICNYGKHIQGETRHVYPLTDTNLHSFITRIHPKKSPRALGAIPRLGIGVRHTTSLWPGIWKAMNRGDFSANAIQNSVRELTLLSSLKAGEKPRTNYLFSFGEVQEGHTGSSFEGLWTSGVTNVLLSEYYPRYGADADHLQVKRGAEGIERTKKFIDAARYYTFYTLDVSDILDYSATTKFGIQDASSYLELKIPNSHLRRDILFYHKHIQSIGKQRYHLDEAMIGRFVGKYWDALDAISELEQYIKEVKNGEPFDLELSIDENPPEIRTFDSITTNAELLFLIGEIQRRSLGITHIAPNFGVEKCTDYRGPDGLHMLQARVATQHRMASENGLMLDCHSGDDLSQETRRVFGSACKGRIHYKISPSLQGIFAEVVSEVHPELFSWWWQQTYEYAKLSANSGSSFAKKALQFYHRSESSQPSAKHFFFKEYNFAAVGCRDNNGQFIHRERFYSISSECIDVLTERIEHHLCSWAEDLFDY